MFLSSLVIFFILYHTTSYVYLYPERNNIVYSILRLRFRQPMKLLVDLPLVEQSAKRHEPDFALRPAQQGYAVKKQPGERFFIAHPADAFFSGCGSLST